MKRENVALWADVECCEESEFCASESRCLIWTFSLVMNDFEKEPSMILVKDRLEDQKPRDEDIEIEFRC